MQNAKVKITDQNLKFTQSKIVVIVGPTSSGKSALAVKLAKKFGGEIVSADSRQVYRGMNIGAGKVPRDRIKIKDLRFKNKKSSSKIVNHKPYISSGVIHHLLDVASPKRRFTVVQYRKLALAAINQILKKGKIPFLVGGTGFYIRAVIDGITIPEVKPDWKLRKKLEKKTAGELFAMLKKLDSARAKTIEPKNKRRLIRAIEIVKKTGKPIPPAQKHPLPFQILMIGIRKSKTELRQAIKKRLLKRLRKGMLREVRRLHNSGISWRRLEEFGLEYRYCAQYLQNKLSYNEMIEKIQKESERYAHRQMAWWKRDKRIRWISNYKQAEKLTRQFILC